MVGITCLFGLVSLAQRVVCLQDAIERKKDAPLMSYPWASGSFQISLGGYMNCSLNSLKGGYIGDKKGDYQRGVREILGI